MTEPAAPAPNPGFRVQNAPRLPGVDEILLPGERGNRLAARRLSSGVIEIEPNLLSGLRVGARELPIVEAYVGWLSGVVAGCDLSSQQGSGLSSCVV